MAPQGGSRYAADTLAQNRLDRDDDDADDDKAVNDDDDDEKVVVEFVIPTGKTEITVTDELHRAHAMCVSASVSCKWIKELDLTGSILRDNQVFVMDPFSGPAFTHVTENRQQVTVLGPKVLITCMETNSPVPQSQGHPVHNCAMQGLSVTSSGLDVEARERAEKLVKLMGGEYSSHLHEGISHLVAAATNSRKYEVAVERDVAVMTVDWLEAVWDVSRKENVTAIHPRFALYRCPALQGVTLSVSQLSKEDRDFIKESVSCHGGEYSGVLERDVTTVLVCDKAEGEKYVAASRWNIPCLTAAWVYDSIEKGNSLPYDGYRVEDCGGEQQIPNWYGIYLPEGEQTSVGASDSMVKMAKLSIQESRESTYDSTLTFDSTKLYMSANSRANGTINSSINATHSTKNSTDISNCSQNIAHHHEVDFGQPTQS